MKKFFKNPIVEEVLLEATSIVRDLILEEMEKQEEEKQSKPTSSTFEKREKRM